MYSISFNALESHLLNDMRPSEYFNRIVNSPKFQEYPYNMLYKLRDTQQSPVHHPEGNAWNHTMLVIDAAAKLKSNSRAPRVLMWAALLHDIGKPSTTRVRKGKITSYDHDKLGAKLAEEFLIQFTDEVQFISRVKSMIRWHMQVLFVLNKLPFADVKNMKSEVDVREIALLGLSDRLGRLGCDEEKELENIRRFLNSVVDV